MTSSYASGPSAESGSNPETYRQNFDVLSSVIANNIYSLTSNLKLIQRLSSKLGTPKGSQRDEQRLNELLDDTTAKFKTYGDDVKVLGDWDSASLQATQKFTQRNLTKDFGGVLDEFRTAQREIAAKERKLSMAQKAAAEEQHQTETTPLLQQQQQQQSQVLDFVSQNEVDFNTSLIEEREGEIQNIERGIYEINAIFKDLGTLVTEQGTQIDAVEDNISNMATNTENASKQLTQADKYQRTRGKWSCIFLLVLLVVSLIVALAILA
ncbi:SNAP receptor PEP12 [Sugiyamaella lignohabitans]|uniref:SNAP receptor PEP12 n=1 Tax=Sugiyamaella lignohabitans TaxID=796027 RepID=A0A167EMR6_9ASCO|nr:SNAP receptor PEP12 [Sugiyamaella lignohabitans]ANB14264.1 SNAP receptor PEP12 [Sugiyamaella lignohabitans]